MSSIATYMPDAHRAKKSSAAILKQTHSKSQTQLGNTERELVLQATTHNHAAFVRLYDQYVDKIHRYIYYRVSNSSDAEDLTSQVFLKAWQAIGNYKWTDRPFAAWLYRIAHNLIVDHFRMHRDAVSLEDIVALEEPGPSPQEIVESRVSSESLRRALLRLTADQQQVIILRVLEGYSTAEVAAILGKQEGAVRTLQHRAMIALKQVLAIQAHA